LFFQPKFILFLGLRKIYKSIMFTTGIFTTHLPYLAFVCMYLIILIGGHGKVPGDVPVADQEAIKVRHFIQNTIHLEEIDCEHWQVNDHFSFRLKRSIFLPARKINHAVHTQVSFVQEMDVYGIFCRPPPEISAGIL
jgi:hypothetical protein